MLLFVTVVDVKVRGAAVKSLACKNWDVVDDYHRHVGERESVDMWVCTAATSGRAGALQVFFF